MKLPFEFGIKLLFRLLLPGFLLSLGTWPALFLFLDTTGWNIRHEYAFGIMFFLLGLLFIVSDMQIYMLFEGRRYWPERLRRALVKRERVRLSRLHNLGAESKLEKVYELKKQLTAADDLNLREKLTDEVQHETRTYLEAWFDLSSFPVDDKIEHSASSPTRLGNLMDAFESYSNRVYGMDAVFYWPRLWLKIDKDLREEIDNRQALVDASVYSSFALYLAGILWLFYAIVGVVISQVARLYGSVGFSLRYLERPWLSLALSLILILCGYVLYRTSLRLHAQFGDVFKAVFDVFASEIDVSAPIAELSSATGGLVSVDISRREQFLTVYRYIRFGLVKCPKCEERILMKETKLHACK